MIEPLVKGAVETMKQSGVKEENIVIENVSGSFELPFSCARYARPIIDLLLACLLNESIL